MNILSPTNGKVVALSDVPDPVFANQLVGAGCAVDPKPDCTEISSPVAGKIAKVHPHAFVVMTDDGIGILCHVGIDTVQLQGEGFKVHVSEGDTVSAGQLILEWNPADIIAKGLSPMVMLAVLDSEPDSVSVSRLGESVTSGDILFEA